MGEIVTKLALLVFGVSLYFSGILSFHFAVGFTAAALLASFLRDANLRCREAIRMFPGFGFWFFVTCFMIVPTNAFLKMMIGLDSWGFTNWEAIAASGILVTPFRLYIIICESISRWTVHALGFDNRKLDYATEYMWRNGFLTRHFYWNGGPDDSYDEYDSCEEYDECDDELEEDDPDRFIIDADVPKCITCCPVKPQR